MTPLLDVRAISVAGRLSPISFEIGDGELVALIGPNGGGKTSLLRAIAGVERTGGRAAIDGEELIAVPPARRPHIATFLPTSRDLTWPISAREVVALGLPRPDSRRVEEVVDMLELRPLADRPARSLSTGERARVLLARALAPSPRLLLLDEPLSNLDPYWVLTLLEILRQTVREGAAALVALHDIDRVPAFDRALLIADGSLQADLAPQAMLESRKLAEAFGIVRAEGSWRVRTKADPQSSR